ELLRPQLPPHHAISRHPRAPRRHHASRPLQHQRPPRILDRRRRTKTRRHTYELTARSDHHYPTPQSVILSLAKDLRRHPNRELSATKSLIAVCHPDRSKPTPFSRVRSLIHSLPIAITHTETCHPEAYAGRRRISAVAQTRHRPPSKHSDSIFVVEIPSWD